MINRNLIRTKVLQIFFSWSQKENKDLKEAENELLDSLQKSYDLYHYLLQIIIEITDEYERKIEQGKVKLRPTKEDINPNNKLKNNLFVKQLRNNIQLKDYLNNSENIFDISVFEPFVKQTLNLILESEIYKEYIKGEDINNYDEDKEFWKKAFSKFVMYNSELYDLLEDLSIYWNDGIDVVESFVQKTIKQFKEENSENQALFPKFADPENEIYAKKLLREAIFNQRENYNRIDKFVTNWNSDRITQMDLVIMQLALSEIQFFPSIPINVSINEYINISKNYSTPKSSSFINGILDSVLKEMKKNGEIVKN